jgi:hypothetical protein
MHGMKQFCLGFCESECLHHQFDVRILDKRLWLGDQLLDVAGKLHSPELTSRTLSRTERVRI